MSVVVDVAVVVEDDAAHVEDVVVGVAAGVVVDECFVEEKRMTDDG